MRLIDANAVKLSKGFFEKVDNVPKFYDWLNSLPTINAVQVVRCKDCKHCDIYENGHTTFCKLGNLMDDIYGFCSDAEMREDERTTDKNEMHKR